MSRDCAMNAHQAYQCRRTADGGYRYRICQRDIDLCGEYHERAACQSSSCSQGGRESGQGNSCGTARVGDVAGNCRFCKLSSIKLNENKLHNIMAKWTIKARDAHFGQFVLREVTRGWVGHMLHNPHSPDTLQKLEPRGSSCILWETGKVVSSNQSSITIKPIRNYALNWLKVSSHILARRLSLESWHKINPEHKINKTVARRTHLIQTRPVASPRSELPVNWNSCDCLDC